MVDRLAAGGGAAARPAMRGLGPPGQDDLSDLLQRRVLVVGAHPDDEIVGVGALLKRLATVGIVTITDGAPRRRGLLQALRSRKYARVRRREAAAALRLLGRDIALVSNFGVPDQQAIFHAAPIARRLTTLLRANPFEYVITHAYEGGHPDHDAVALAVDAACRGLEASGGNRPTLVEMTGYFAAEEGTVYGEFLPHPNAGAVWSFPLCEAGRDLKRRMFACHASQAQVLAHIPLDAERLRRAPAYDFLRPPHAGQLGYERHDWDIDGSRWRKEAERALQRL